MMSTDAGDQAGACARDLKITVENGNDDCVLEIATQAGQHMAQPRYVESVGRPLAGKSPELPQQHVIIVVAVHRQHRRASWRDLVQLRHKRLCYR